MSVHLRLMLWVSIIKTSVAFGVTSVAFAGITDAKVYTIRSSPVAVHTETSIAYLDDAHAIEERISADLPSDPARAHAIVLERLRDGGTGLQHELAAAYQDIADAWSLGITTLPAVVVERRYVIYGDADVARALARIEAFRSAEP